MKDYHLIFFQETDLQKPPDQLINKQDKGDIKTDIEENSPFQENITPEIYEGPNKSLFSRTN